MRIVSGVLVCAFAAAVPFAGRGESGAQAAAAGAQLFQSSGCAHCHGETLAGTETGPSLRDAGRRLKPDAIANQIRHGGGAMPAFGDVFQDDQVMELVAYLKQQKARVPKGKTSHAGGAAGML